MMSYPIKTLVPKINLGQQSKFDLNVKRKKRVRSQNKKGWKETIKQKTTRGSVVVRSGNHSLVNTLIHR